MAKILIVDDSESLRLDLRDTLESAGHEVVEAINGEEGIKAMSKHSDTKIIVIDFNMPIMNGITMAQRIREMPEYSHVKLLMLTTESSKEARQAGKDAGILAWITKPLVGDKFTPVVEMILARK